MVYTTVKLGSVVDELNAINKGLHDFSPALTLASLYVYKEVSRQFTTSGAHMGTRWAPLKPATIARRRNHSSMPLLDTRRLNRSVVGRSGVGSVYELTPTHVRFGTNLHYAAKHQYGYPRRHIPARPYLMITDKMSNRITEIFREWMSKQK